ncbi:MAG: diaminopimelate dehydrogenase [Clostridia bacterium]|nr:diaminopimelate dehydrogenase [Clostridia bacterium]
MKTKIAIVGYGNVGKSIEKLAVKSEDFEVVGIFSRRNGTTSPFGTNVYLQSTLLDAGFSGKIDVALLAVGSAFDLIDTAKKVGVRYNFVDCFDTHAKMREYLKDMNLICRACETLALVGCGWDPGLFSLERALLFAVVPNSIPQTFWGKGVSQGHSEAIRNLDGVKYATQYTIPIESAVQAAKEERVDFLPSEKHLRECFVVLDCSKYFGKETVSDEEKRRLECQIREQIENMPNYFADYQTTVHFVSEEEYLKNHVKAYHAGEVIACSRDGAKSVAEFSLKLDSNPDFTANVMLACAKANHRMWRAGETGAKTLLDVPVKYLLDGDGVDYV